MNHLESKRILITGGTGFVGQSIAKLFLKEGQNVKISDVNTQVAGGEGVVECDVFNLEKLKDVVKESNIIIHLVGLADAGVAQRDPERSFKLNVLSLQNLLEICRVFGDKKIIFPSSAAVYGTPDMLPIKENFPPNPTNIYSWHKYICEQLIKAYHDNFGLEYVVLRLFNVYGQGNKGVINVFLKSAAQREVIKSFGPYQYRDFVYAGDVAQAFYKSAVYEKANNRIINIGTGKGTQIKEILDLICTLYPGAKWITEKKPFVTYDSIADITLARILLDFKPHASQEFMKKVIEKEMMKEIEEK